MMMRESNRQSRPGETKTEPPAQIAREHVRPFPPPHAARGPLHSVGTMPTAFMALTPALLEALRRVAPKSKLPRLSILLSMSLALALFAGGVVTGYTKRVHAMAEAQRAISAAPSPSIATERLATAAPADARVTADPPLSTPAFGPPAPPPLALPPSATPAVASPVPGAATSSPKTSNPPRKPHRRTSR
jgi:hypothetical protein